MSNTPLLRSVFFISAMLLVAACSETPYDDGRQLFISRCANCHLDDGQGVGALIPPIDSSFLRTNRNRLPCILRNGLADTLIIQGRLYAEQMPGNPDLNEIELANLLNYVYHRWSSGAPPFDLDEINTSLSGCKNLKEK